MLPGNGLELPLTEDRAVSHERVVELPEISARSSEVLDELGCSAGLMTIREREMPVHVTQSTAEAITQMSDHLVGSMAVRTNVAAILHERDLGVGCSEDVITSRVDRRVKTSWTCRIHSRGHDVSRGSSGTCTLLNAPHEPKPAGQVSSLLLACSYGLS